MEHKTLEERKKVASECAKSLELNIPLLVDDMENTVANAYSANPDRLFIVNTDGKIAFAGERGPWGFDVDAMVTALKELVK